MDLSSMNPTLNTTKLRQACSLVKGVRRGLWRLKIHNSVFTVSFLSSRNLIYIYLLTYLERDIDLLPPVLTPARD